MPAGRDVYIRGVHFEKHFTPTEAARTLPLVKRIVHDILATGRRMRELSAGGQVAEPARDEYERLERNLADLFRELEEIGCSYKDWSFEVGLVDFPALIDGEEVWLCWRSDEPALRYYHDLDKGYAGRKEIPARYLAGNN